MSTAKAFARAALAWLMLLVCMAAIGVVADDLRSPEQAVVMPEFKHALRSSACTAYVCMLCPPVRPGARISVPNAYDLLPDICMLRLTLAMGYGGLVSFATLSYDFTRLAVPILLLASIVPAAVICRAHVERRWPRMAEIKAIFVSAILLPAIASVVSRASA